MSRIADFLPSRNRLHKAKGQLFRCQDSNIQHHKRNNLLCRLLLHSGYMNRWNVGNIRRSPSGVV